MDFTTRDFLILNTVIVLLLVFYFLFWKRNKPYKGFRLKDTRNSASKHSSLANPFISNKNHQKKDHDHKEKKPNIKSDPRSINIIFAYNGHEWDAYEVLGIPAGSSLETVKQAYEKMLSKIQLREGKKSKVFFDTAYQAILEGRATSSPHKN